MTIQKSGEYAPFAIKGEQQSGVTVQTADGVTATVKTDKDSKVAVTAADVTLKGLDFVSEDGTAVISGGACDGLTLDNCSFENKKDDLKDTIALYPPQRRLIFRSPAIPLIPATGTSPISSCGTMPSISTGWTAKIPS